MVTNNVDKKLLAVQKLITYGKVICMAIFAVSWQKNNNNKWLVSWNFRMIMETFKSIRQTNYAAYIIKRSFTSQSTSIGKSSKQSWPLIVIIVVYKRSHCSCEVSNFLIGSAKYYDNYNSTIKWSHMYLTNQQWTKNSSWHLNFFLRRSSFRRISSSTGSHVIRYEIVSKVNLQKCHKLAVYIAIFYH